MTTYPGAVTDLAERVERLERRVDALPGRPPKCTCGSYAEHHLCDPCYLDVAAARVERARRDAADQECEEIADFLNDQGWDTASDLIGSAEHRRGHASGAILCIPKPKERLERVRQEAADQERDRVVAYLEAERDKWDAWEPGVIQADTPENHHAASLRGSECEIQAAAIARNCHRDAHRQEEPTSQENAAREEDPPGWWAWDDGWTCKECGERSWTRPQGPCPKCPTSLPCDEIECDCCGNLAAKGRVTDGDPLLCGCDGRISVDAESDPYTNTEDCTCGGEGRLPCDEHGGEPTKEESDAAPGVDGEPRERSVSVREVLDICNRVADEELWRWFFPESPWEGQHHPPVWMVTRTVKREVEKLVVTPGEPPLDEVVERVTAALTRLTHLFRTEGDAKEAARAAIAAMQESGWTQPGDWNRLMEQIALQVGDEEDHDIADASDPNFVAEFDPWDCLRRAGQAFERLGKKVARLTEENARLRGLADRVVTVADEETGPHPVQSPDEALTCIERALFERRVSVERLREENARLREEVSVQEKRGDLWRDDCRHFETENARLRQELTREEVEDSWPDRGCVLGDRCVCPHLYHESWECATAEDMEEWARTNEGDADTKGGDE